MEKISPPNGTTERIGESIGYLEIAAERKLQLLKLDAAEKIARSGGGIVSGGIMLGLGSVTMLTLNLGIGFSLAEWTPLSVGTSFLLLSLINVILIVLVFWQRQKLFTNPILSIVIKKLF